MPTVAHFVLYFKIYKIKANMPRKEHKYHFIYKTSCVLNEAYYIGMHSTSNLDDEYLGSGKRLNYSIKKYGKENFKREILEYVETREELKQREADLVNDDLLKDPKCMNLQHGGGGGFSSEEHRIKAIKAGNIARTKNSIDPLKFLHTQQDWCEKFSKSISDGMKGIPNAWKGRNHSVKTKQKIKNTCALIHPHKGSKNSQYGKIWVYNENLQQSKSIKKEELDFYLKLNWTKGRKIFKI